MKQHTHTVIGRIVQVETPSQITLKVHLIDGVQSAQTLGGRIKLLLTDEASRHHSERTARVLAMGQKPILLYRAIVSDLPEHPHEILFSSIIPHGRADTRTNPHQEMIAPPSNRLFVKIHKNHV